MLPVFQCFCHSKQTHILYSYWWFCSEKENPDTKLNKWQSELMDVCNLYRNIISTQ